MKYDKESTYGYKGKNVVFKYSTNPPLSKKMEIVDDIVNGVINDIIGYEPILRNYFIQVSIISSLTTIEMPEGFNDSAEFLSYTNMCDIITDIMPDLYAEIVSAADEKIKYKLAQSATRTKLDDLFDTVISIINKYGEMFDGVNITDVVNQLSTISKMADMPESSIVKNILQFEDEKQKKVDAIDNIVKTENKTD